MFLIPKDYQAIIRAEIRQAVANDDQFNVEFAEMAARQTMEDHLRQRFDVAKIFPDVLPFDPGGQYSPGAMVYYPLAPLTDQKVYRAKEDVTDQVPGAEGSTGWELKDGRQPSIKMYLLDLTIYHLYAAAPVIPQLRVDRHDAAMKWLQLVLKNDITPDLPSLPEITTEPAESSPLRSGSREKLRHER